MPTHVQVAIRGMHCASCVTTIEQIARSTSGVLRAEVNLSDDSASLDVDSARFNAPELDRALRARGYSLLPDRQHFQLSGVDPLPGGLEEELASLPGVMRVELNSASQFLTIEVIPTLFTWAAAEAILKRAGIRAEPIASHSAVPDDLNATRWRALVALGGAALLMAAMLMHLHLPWLEFPIATVVLFWAGAHYHLAALRGLRNLAVDMNTLIALATNAAYGYSLYLLLKGGHSFFETSTMIIAILLLGRWIELRARHATRGAVRALLDLTPKNATLLRGDQEIAVPLDQLRPGDRVLVRPGERVPSDGRIEEGASEIDESMLTGESVPVCRQRGDEIVGGTLNLNGALRVQVTRTGEQTLLAQIIRLVRETQGSKAPAQRIADRWAAIFVPIVLTIATVTLVTWLLIDPPSALHATMAVLLVACPCAFGLATPTAVMVASGRAAQLGILFKTAAMLEAPAQLTTLVFDKTGTLTVGRPVVHDVFPAPGLSKDDVLRVAASVERSSEHPIARAILAAAPADVAPAPNFEARPGLGAIAGEFAVGNRQFMELLDVAVDHKPGHVYVARGTTLMGSIKIADAPREEARPIVAHLANRGLRIVMLTGDDRTTAEHIARELGIQEIRAEVMPQDKADEVKKLQETGRVAMIGDGLNDAPALAQADVGIALASGTDVAMESAGVVLVKGGLRKVTATIDLSRRARRTIHQNFAWAFGYNALLLPIAAGLFRSWGIALDPMLAAVAMALSSIAVVANSLRLRRFSPRS